MKLHERLEQLAQEREAEAASIRRTLEILTGAETVRARKSIDGKFAKAISLRNGNGNGNGVGNGVGRPPLTAGRVRDYLETQANHKARLGGITAALGIPMSSVKSALTIHPEMFKRIAVGVYQLRAKDGQDASRQLATKAAKPKRSHFNKTARKRLSLAAKRRWREAKKSGMSLMGKKLKSAETAASA